MMVDPSEDFNLDELQAFYKEDSIARVFLDNCAERRNNRRETTVERVQQIVAGYGIENPSRADVIGVFRTLESIGCGKFVTGRRGGKSRLIWTHDMIEVGRSATGEDDKTAEYIDSSEDGMAVDMITHMFHLRPDIAIEIDLPDDLTPVEADRLSRFLTSLPFDGE